jgi:hypothetical protein
MYFFEYAEGKRFLEEECCPKRKIAEVGNKSQLPTVININLNFLMNYLIIIS